MTPNVVMIQNFRPIMAEDREVLREVWQGRVPVAFSLSSDDVHTMGQPDPYHLMLPRLSYITVVFDKVYLRTKAEISSIPGYPQFDP